MKRVLSIPIALALVVALISPSLGLTDYQRGVLDGLNRGWYMAQNYDLAKTGDPSSYNQAVTKYNAWIESIFGRNESLMLKPFAAPATKAAEQYSVTKTFTPIHSIDASWNQSQQYLLPKPDASGLVYGYPAEMYYSIGPALEFL